MRQYYGQSPVFPECDECGHPRVSHAAGRCFCGCAGPRQNAEPEIYHAEPAADDPNARSYTGARDGWSQEEDALLERRYQDGTAISRLSDLHGRRPSSIITRLSQLGLRN